LPEEAGSEAAAEAGFVSAGVLPLATPASSFGISLAQASRKKQRKQTIRAFTIN
jgi:hypothetical protein